MASIRVKTGVNGGVDLDGEEGRGAVHVLLRLDARHHPDTHRDVVAPVHVGERGQGCATPIAQERSTQIISVMKWIRTSRLSVKLSLGLCAVVISWSRFRGRCEVTLRLHVLTLMLSPLRKD